MSDYPTSPATNINFLNHLIRVIRDRKAQRHDPAAAESSYTVSLFRRGINKIAQKVGEEAVELVIEAKDSDDERFRNEAADLMYHFLVLLEEKEVSLEEVIQVLEERHGGRE